MSFVSISGFRMFYDTRGSGDVIAHIHGGFPSLSMHLRPAEGTVWEWEQDFADHFRFIMYNRRGCWSSSRPDNGYDLVTQARDLARLLDHLAIEKAHVIGSSAGGPIAVLFASLFRERTRTLVLGGTAAYLLPQDHPIAAIVREQVRVLRREGHEAAWRKRPEGVEVSLDVLWEREEMKERGVLSDYESQSSSLAHGASLIPEAERMKWHATQLRAIHEYIERDVSHDCERVTAPTLVVHGARDREVPVEWGKDLASRIRGSEVRIYPNESHSAIHRSAFVRKDAIEFMKRHG